MAIPYSVRLAAFCMELSDINRISSARNVLTLRQVRTLHSLITEKRLLSCLELGIGEAIAASVIADVLKELRGGSLTSLRWNVGCVVRPDGRTTLQRTGPSPLIDNVQGRESVETFFRGSLADQPHHDFDFCFIDCHRAPQALLRLVPTVSGLLKPEAWIGIYEQPPPARSVERHHGITASRLGVQHSSASLNRVFNILLERSSSFFNFRRIERLYLAQKRPDCSSEHSGMIDVAVALAIERSYRDPDFRFDLLERPSTALGVFLELDAAEFEGISFRECNSTKSIFDCTIDIRSRVYHLEKPKWNTLKPESYYLDLLAAKNSHPSE